MIHGFDIFGPIISKLVCELTFKPLLLLHHVVHIMTTVARHYMHTAEMKKCEFIRNKVVECIVKTSVEMATLIPHTNVTHGIDDLNEIGHAWMVRNQQHSNMTYNVATPLWPSVRMELTLPKVGDLEPPRLPNL
jgi:hypothetical protein